VLTHHLKLSNFVWYLYADNLYIVFTVAPDHLIIDKTPMGVEENDSVSITCTDTYKPADDSYHESATNILNTPTGNYYYIKVKLDVRIPKSYGWNDTYIV